MQTSKVVAKKVLKVLISVLFLQFALVLQSWKKDPAEILPAGGIAMRKGKPHNPPPPTFYFYNCHNPTNSATFQAGVPVNTPIV